MRILIQGNGVFYNFAELELDTKSVNRRLKELVPKFVGTYIKFNGDFHSELKEISNKFVSASQLLNDNSNYEDIFGDVIADLIKKYSGKKIDIKQLKAMYNHLTSVFIGILFVKLNKPNAGRKLQSIRFMQNYEETYRLNYIDVHQNHNSNPLHGHCYPLSWTDRILTNYPNIAENPDELVYFLNYHGDVLSYNYPPLFGKNIEQKNELLSILRGRHYKDYAQLFDNDNIREFEESITYSNYPYKRLKDSSKFSTIDIVGVNMKNHLELLEWIAEANEINIYCKTEEDILFVSNLSKTNKKIKLKTNLNEMYLLR